MNIKNNKRSKESSKKLKNTLLNELKIKKLNEIKIKHLCEKAKVNRTTFYAHYDCVEDILYEICEDEINEVYRVFQNNNIDYKSKLKNGIIIIKNNLDKFKYFFEYVHNIEEKILNVVEFNNIKQNKQIVPFEILSLVFVISGFVGVGKIYLHEIDKNPNFKLNLDEFTEIVYNSININNPYFNFK